MTCERHIGPFPCCSVVQGDCLELMKQLPDGCVDAVITDPPYLGLVGGYDLSAVDNGSWMAPACNTSLTVGDKWGATLEWVSSAKRISRLGAEVFCSYHFVGELERSFADWRKVMLLTWHKRNAPITGANVPRFTTEFVWCFAKQPGLKWDNFDSTLIDIPKLATGCMAPRERIVTGPTKQAAHPTQKPEEVMLIVCDVNADIILDPFCGSGTTLVAAKKLGRHFLGFEISEQYCEIARRRLAEIDAQPTLFEQKPEQLSL